MEKYENAEEETVAPFIPFPSPLEANFLVDKFHGDIGYEVMDGLAKRALRTNCLGLQQ